jgi:hypothetical protein
MSVTMELPYKGKFKSEGVKDSYIERLCILLDSYSQEEAAVLAYCQVICSADEEEKLNCEKRNPCPKLAEAFV